MASNFIVSTLFSARDRISATFGRAGRNADRFSNRASRAFDRAGRRASQFGSRVRAILTAGAISRGFALLSRGVRGVTEEFIDFDQALTAATAKFNIERGTKQFDELGDSVRKIGQDTEFSAAQAARGLNFMAFAGFNAEQSMKALPRVVDLATATETDLAMASDIVTDSLGAFGLNATDTATKLKNLDRVANVLGMTTITTNTNLETLFDVVKDVGPIAKTAGVDIEQFSTLAGLMANAGIKGTKAGTAMKNMFLNLAGPTKQQKKLLKSLNVEVGDSEGNFKGFFKILQDVRAATDKMGTRTRAAALNTLFGKRAIAGAAITLDQTNRILEATDKKLRKGGRTITDVAEMMRKSLGNRLKALQSSSIELGFKFIDSFVDPADEGIQSLTKSIRDFDVKPIVDGLKAVIQIVSALHGFLSDHRDEIALLVKGYFALKAMIFAVSLAQWFLNGAMLANPMALVGLAAVGLTGYIVSMGLEMREAGMTWEETLLRMENKAIRTVNALKEVFNGLARAINRTHEVLSGQGAADILAGSLGADVPDRAPLINQFNLKEDKLAANDRRIEELAAIRHKEALAQIDSEHKAKMDAIRQETMAWNRAFDDRNFVTSNLPDLADRLLGDVKGQSIQVPTIDTPAPKSPELTAPNVQEGGAEGGPQKVEVTGKFDFNKPPPGMLFEGAVGGLPVTTNLGKN